MTAAADQPCQTPGCGHPACDHVYPVADRWRCYGDGERCGCTEYRPQPAADQLHCASPTCGHPVAIHAGWHGPCRYQGCTCEHLTAPAATTTSGVLESPPESWEALALEMAQGI